MLYDVKTGFLYNPLAETIYMLLPPSYDSVVPGKVCHLLKSLYGLRQVPYIWDNNLHDRPVKLGVTCIEKDHGLYARHVGGNITRLVTVFVDDLLLIGPANLCKYFAAEMQATFQLSSLGEVRYLLGIDNQSEMPMIKARGELTKVTRAYARTSLVPETR